MGLGGVKEKSSFGYKQNILHEIISFIYVCMYVLRKEHASFFGLVWLGCLVWFGSVWLNKRE